MTPLPAAFVERMSALLGEEASALCAALERAPVAGLRVNTLKATPEELRALVNWRLEPVPWCAGGFVIEDEARAGKHPFHAAGLYYLQEPSAMAVAEALAPQPDEWVLDLAAAPGGKATHLASILGDGGLLAANEIDPARARIVAQNLERCGVRNALVVCAEPAQLAQRWGAVFDRVLLDAPCSGEGMFRKSEPARAAWSEAQVRGCAVRQAHGLDSAGVLVKPGGLLAYSTCTFAPEENERVIAAFLGRRPEFSLEATAVPHADPGRDEWLAETPTRGVRMGACARLWPHRVRGEGHFIALLRRADASAADRATRRQRWKSAGRRAAAQWTAFWQESLGADPAAGSVLTMVGERLVAVPERAPSLDGLRAVQAGIELGSLRGERFAPSHGLAATLRRPEPRLAAHPPLDLNAADPRLLRYLEGHPLDSAGVDGWTLVSVEGFPIGWGRRSKGILKNHYPKGLRRSP